MTKKLYAERNPIQQGEHFLRHIMAMTTEGLHSKGDIASELAHRDIEIERLNTALSVIADGKAEINVKRFARMCMLHERGNASDYTPPRQLSAETQHGGLEGHGKSKQTDGEPV